MSQTHRKWKTRPAPIKPSQETCCVSSWPVHVYMQCWKSAAWGQGCCQDAPPEKLSRYEWRWNGMLSALLSGITEEFAEDWDSKTHKRLSRRRRDNEEWIIRVRTCFLCFWGLIADLSHPFHPKGSSLHFLHLIHTVLEATCFSTFSSWIFRLLCLKSLCITGPNHPQPLHRRPGHGKCDAQVNFLCTDCKDAQADGAGSLTAYSAVESKSRVVSESVFCHHN